jgi:hypothetical protein
VGEYDLNAAQLFTDYEQELFTRVVSVAEKEGKTVELLVVPGVNPFDALVQTAARLKASKLVTGVSARMDRGVSAYRQVVGAAAEPRHAFSLEIISPDRPSISWARTAHLALWPKTSTPFTALLDLCEKFGSKLHHRDVVGVALRRMVREMRSGARDEVVRDVAEEIRRHPSAKTNEEDES